MDINNKIIEQGKAEISKLLDEHIVKINEAWLNIDNELTISLGLKFAPGQGAGEIKMTTSITFVESRIKESNTITFDNEQRQLFD